MKLFSIHFFCIISCLFLTTATPLASAAESAFVPTGFQLYYGSDPEIMLQLQHQMRTGQVDCHRSTRV